MAEDNRNEEKGTQRSNELSWSSDPEHVPGQHASDPNPSETRPGNPPTSDDDDEIREPNTGAEEDDDDTMKRGGMGRDHDTDPGEPGRGGMGGTEDR